MSWEEKWGGKGGGNGGKFGGSGRKCGICLDVSHKDLLSHKKSKTVVFYGLREQFGLQKIVLLRRI